MTMIQLIACIGMIAGLFMVLQCLAARTERQSFFPLDRSSWQYPCRYQRNDQAKKGRVPPA